MKLYINATHNSLLKSVNKSNQPLGSLITLSAMWIFVGNKTEVKVIHLGIAQAPGSVCSLVWYWVMDFCKEIFLKTKSLST